MASGNLILAGDIGGTKTSLGLFSVNGDKLRAESTRTYPSQGYSGLVPVLQEFLAGDNPNITAACFGIAGPVVDGKVQTPNLPFPSTLVIDPKGIVRWRFIEKREDKRPTNQQIVAELRKIKSF